MPPRLIVNADDFGLTRGVNRAIAELHQAGVVTSTTLMATGAAFDHAVSTAAWLPKLGIGCHVVLTDGTPACSPDEIPTLLGGDRKSFRPVLSSFVLALLLGRIREQEIEREAEAQIRKLQQAGIRVTHVDTHKHTHLFPQVARPLWRAAKRCGVSAIRNPFQPSWSGNAGREHVRLSRLLQVAVLDRLKPSFQRLLPPEATTAGTLGVAATGCLDASVLHAILEAVRSYGREDEVYELVCHPGYNDADLALINTRLRAERETERSALLQELASPTGLELIHYGDLSR